MDQDSPITDFQITNELSARVRAGINIFQDIAIPETRELDTHIQKELASIPRLFQKEPPPGYAFSRQLYRDFHIDPTKHRPSSEALWRRLKKKGDFPRVNPFVDLTNLLSLTFQICFGLYDLDRISGGIRLTLGTDSDHYRGIRKDVLRMGGRIILKDNLGAFGNPSSDSLRTAVSGDTKQILQVLFFHPLDPEAESHTRNASRAFDNFFRIGNTDTKVVPPPG